MEGILEEFEESNKQGGTVEFGWKEKDRKKEMSEAMKKLKDRGDENKIMFAKTLARYYGILNNMGYISTIPNFPFEDKYGLKYLHIYLENFSFEDKYGLNYFHIYLENFVDSAKRIIAGVMTALANDEKIRPFYKYLMFTHIFTPEEIFEIDREKINREIAEIKKEIDCEEFNREKIIKKKKIFYKILRKIFSNDDYDDYDDDDDDDL